MLPEGTTEFKVLSKMSVHDERPNQEKKEKSNISLILKNRTNITRTKGNKSQVLRQCMHTVTEYENNLKDIDDNVEGGIGNEHDVIPASQSFSPGRPLDDVSILDHLIENCYHTG